MQNRYKCCKTQHHRVSRSFHRLVRGVVSDNVHLSDEDSKANSHGDGNDWKIDARKVETTDPDMFPSEDVSPEHAGKRRTECRAERPVVDANRHAVHRRPECAVGYGSVVHVVNFLPCLDDAGEENGGADVRASKLQGHTQFSLSSLILKVYMNGI